MLSELKQGARVAGVKQTRRAIEDGRAARVFLAEDADLDRRQPDARLLDHRLEHIVQQGGELAVKGGHFAGSLPQQRVPFVHHIPNCHI